LCKRYGRVVALDGLLVRVSRGVIYGLLGPNGAGKSTFMRILMGMVSPDRGGYRLLGVDPREDRGVYSRVGYVPENPGLPGFLTGLELLVLAGRLYGLGAGESRRRAKRLIEELGLSPAENRLVGSYSRGMVQRLAIAQALLPDPELLIMDEPASGLDPQGRAELKRMLRRLAGRGCTVLLSSHVLSEVEEVCDRVALIKGGRLILEGGVGSLTGGSLTLEVELAEPVQGIAEELENVEGVLEVEASGRVLRLVLKDGGPGIRSRVSKLIVEKGGLIISMRVVGGGLEGLYVSLVGGGG
jgi:ABC-2 type transport system ATP-binding protein